MTVIKYRLLMWTLKSMSWCNDWWGWLPRSRALLIIKAKMAHKIGHQKKKLENEPTPHSSDDHKWAGDRCRAWIRQSSNRSHQDVICWRHIYKIIESEAGDYNSVVAAAASTVVQHDYIQIERETFTSPISHRSTNKYPNHCLKHAWTGSTIRTRRWRPISKSQLKAACIHYAQQLEHVGLTHLTQQRLLDFFLTLPPDWLARWASSLLKRPQIDQMEEKSIQVIIIFSRRSVRSELWSQCVRISIPGCQSYNA